MRRFITGLLAAFGLVCLITIAVIAGTLWTLLDGWPGADPLGDEVVLSVRLAGMPDESSARGDIESLIGASGAAGLVDLVDAIDRAAGDGRVKALFADLSGAEPGFAQAQELRAAVFRFRATGKPAVAFSDSFESTASTDYYLASAFDRIWMQPSGLLGLTGISMELPLARGLMEELGLNPQFEARYEYKGAMAFLTEDDFPPALRENYTRIAESLYGQMVSGIASARRLGGATVSEMIDAGPLLADEAAANGLIDQLGYRLDAELDAAAGVAEGPDAMVGALAYLADAGTPHDAGTRIALLHLDGAIERGRDSGLDRSGNAGSYGFAAAVDEILNDGEVRAVILRISSPGGSFVASDTMRRAVGRLREAGLPVVASFGDMAASGGYFAALPASHVLAHPGTLTGSIGAVGGKVSAAGLLDEWDIAVGRVEVGDNAGMFSVTRPFTPSQDRRMKRILDAIYEDFAGKVGEARGLSDREVDAVARGRVWTGEDAERVGLVDALGGYAEALQLARQAVGIGPDAPVERVRFPRDRDFADELLDLLSGGQLIEAMSRLATLGRILGELDRHIGPHVGVAHRSAEGRLIRLQAPPITVR